MGSGVSVVDSSVDVESDMPAILRVAWNGKGSGQLMNWMTTVATGLRRNLLAAACCGALVTVMVSQAPVAGAQNCAPGFEPNPYTAECLSPVNTPTINGVPCVASKLGLCSSFVQNQQPRRVPGPVA